MAKGDIIFTDPTSPVVDVLDTGLNALAFDALAGQGVIIDNTANKHRFIDLYFFFSSVQDLSTHDFPYNAVYLVPDFEGGGAVWPDTIEDHNVGRIGFDSNTGQRYGVITGIPIGPYEYKPDLRNKIGTGFTFEAVDTNTLSYRTYTDHIEQS